MRDLLRMDYINSLPQPLLVRFWGSKDWWWPLYDICVKTGLLRIDVCGKLQVSDIGEVAEFRDESGRSHNPETFFTDWEESDQ